MNLSEDSSSDESSIPAKRTRIDTYGASSTTSHGSVLQESDEDSPATSYADNYALDNTRQNTAASLKYSEEYSEGLYRQRRSSISENYSSPNEQSDDCRPTYRDKDVEDDDENPSFQIYNDNTFYNRKTDNSTEYDTKSGSHTDPTKGLSTMGYKPGFQENSSFQTYNENAFYNRKTEDVIESDDKSTSYSEISKRMMSSMGYKPGKGLGKYEHGRVEPVEASTQKGRRGLGAKPSVVGEIPKDLKWQHDQATPEAKEKVMEMPNSNNEPLNDTTLEKWLKRGPRKLTIDDEINFVEPQILKGVLDSKTIFDSLQDEDMRKARFRSNPYETIGSVIFLNRAAVKMANIDAIFDFIFTVPKDQNGKEIVGKNDLLYFADVCAGPGGFSEYILYRRGWRAKGFGFTLKNNNDFKLGEFIAGTAETFNAYYGVKDDGNIFDPANLLSLKEFVLKQTDDLGVHFLMADGGFSVEGQENIQEILSKQLYLCQCLAALMLVRTEGNFVVKLFDVFTCFSVGLIYLMYKCFRKVCIHKPVTSRPANSERYLICFWKRPNVDAVEKHLFSVNSKLWNNHGHNDDVTELVPLSVLQEDKGFFDYIYRSNCSLGENQIKNLLKIAEYSKDPKLKEESQATMKTQCLQLWKLPNQARVSPKNTNGEETLSIIFDKIKTSCVKTSNSSSLFKNNILSKPPHYINLKSDLNVFKNVYDWQFTFLSSTQDSPDLRIFIGCGGKKVYQLDGTTWKSVAQLHITMPAKTLLYGEVVKEYRGEGNNQLHSKALHIIDALMLGGIDISNEALAERVNQCALFCKALEKQNVDGNVMPIRYKKFFNMETFSSALANLEYRAMKRIRSALTINVPRRSTNNDMFYIVGSLLFIKELKDQWVAKISKTRGMKYYFGVGSDGQPRSEFHIPTEARQNMMDGFSGRVMWPWGDAARAIYEGQTTSCISKLDMEQYINEKL